MVNPIETPRFPSHEEKLDPGHTALVIVDVQNDFCHPDGIKNKCGLDDMSDLTAMEQMREPLYRLLQAARAANAFRVHIKAIYDPIYLSPSFAEKMVETGIYGKICQSGTWGSEFWEPISLQPGPREIEVIKHRNSAFVGTKLLQLLRSNSIQTVVVTGVVTSGCVDSTARDAFFNDFYVFIPKDGTADYTEEKWSNHLAKLGRLYSHVVDTKFVIDIWEQHRARNATPVAAGATA